MRIAVITHALEEPGESEREYLIGVLARLWQGAGHEVRFLPGGHERWQADIGIVHVDLSVVPRRYVRAARRYPVVVNGDITDIRKSVTSMALVDRHTAADRPVIVKSDLNSNGLPEEKYRRRTPAHRWLQRLGIGPVDTPMRFQKDYAIHPSYEDIPIGRLARPGAIVERFIPEREGASFAIRRCIIFGDRSISVRVTADDPIVGAPRTDSQFEWIADDPDVLKVAKRLRLDFGKIDYVLHNGQAVVFDVNKTMGMGAATPHQEDYHLRIAEAIAPGIKAFAG